MMKRDLWKVRKWLERIEENLSEIKSILNSLLTEDEQTVPAYEASKGKGDTVSGSMNGEETKISLRGNANIPEKEKVWRR